MSTLPMFPFFYIVFVFVAVVIAGASVVGVADILKP